MTKKDWTILFIRILGFIWSRPMSRPVAVTTASLIIASNQTRRRARAASQAYMWSGPFAALLVLLIGRTLVRGRNRRDDVAEEG